MILSGGPAAAQSTVCKITSSGFAFGSYDPYLASPTDTIFSVLVGCSRTGSPQNITVNLGVGPGSYSATPAGRRMLHTGGSGAYLPYGLYRDASRVSPVGTTQTVDTLTQSLSVPNNGSAQATFTIYGRIPAQMDVPAGSYSDNVQVTVSP